MLPTVVVRAVVCCWFPSASPIGWVRRQRPAFRYKNSLVRYRADRQEAYADPTDQIIQRLDGERADQLVRTYRARAERQLSPEDRALSHASQGGASQRVVWLSNSESREARCTDSSPGSSGKLRLPGRANGRNVGRNFQSPVLAAAGSAVQGVACEHTARCDSNAADIPRLVPTLRPESEEW